jgi:hypothetical protein
MSSAGNGARVRVFLPTYRRASLLPRAIASLRAQSVEDWICELHNDDPADPFPARLVHELADPRIHFFQHTTNLGPVETFNRFYRPTPEPFYALLEDDNTWEPAFLETMLAALNAFPAATLAWCNQRIVEETAAGDLAETGKLANPPDALDARPRSISWGNVRQIFGALHANGAMLLRSRDGESYPTPSIPFSGVESFRERLFPHPLLYVPQPLATFTVTRHTARDRDFLEWGALRAALAATFLKHAHLDRAAYARLCGHCRSQRPATTDTLILAAAICRESRPILRQLRFTDWFRFLKSAVRHPGATLCAMRVRSRHPDWWDLLDRHTAARFRETPASPADRPA